MQIIELTKYWNWSTTLLIITINQQSADKNDNIFQWMTLAYSEKENPSSPNNEPSLMALLAPTSLM